MYKLTNYQEIAAAEKIATDKANAENHQASYNAGWLHGYARALADVRRQLDPSEYFAVVRWMIDDLKEICPDWTDEQCRNWWKANEKTFEDLLTQYGNECLSDMI